MKNTLITASAGTGKTFALATRAIRLLLMGVEPQEIVALTFSRAAAGEIFDRIVSRLAEAALSDAGAARESKTLECATPLGKAAFAQLLRTLIFTQHLTRIGTVDSFMVQMVRSFPLELGLQGSMTLMEDYLAAREKRAAVDAMLGGGVRNSEFRIQNSELRMKNEEFENPLHPLSSALRLATIGREAKTFCRLLDDFIRRYHETVLDVPDPFAWGVPEAVWGKGGIPFRNHGDVKDLADALSGEAFVAPWCAVEREATWRDFCDAVRDFDGSFSEKAAVRRVLEGYAPTGDITISYNRKKVTFTGTQADTIRGTVETMAHIALALRCVTTQGVFRLMRQAEDLYQRNTRRKGLLTFGDIPRLIAGLDETARLNVEYRFDGRFRHWALDEFQDTSREQWAALHQLVEEVIADDGERSLLIVGDAKQAIYGWRGGDVALFEAEAESGQYELGELSMSYRFRPEIAHIVNRVFDGERVAEFLEAGGEFKEDGAGERWRRLWAEHTSAREGEAGYVEVMRVRAKEKEEEIWEPFVEPLVEELQKVRPWERGITTAILVTRNDHGEELANALRMADIPAIWEGESALADTPVVMAFLNLLRFAEHPGDTLAWQHICATPLVRQGVLGECFECGRLQSVAVDCSREQPSVVDCSRLQSSAVARKVQGDVVSLGLPRALQMYIDGIRDTLGGDSFTRSRLDALVRAASQFTGMADANATLTDFADFVLSFKTRTVAESSDVKILTVHRSKGLGFDFVLLPVMDHFGMDRMRGDDVFAAPDGKSWLFDRMPPSPVVELDETLRGAMRAARSAEAFETLCRYYVGMTRAKVALKVLLREGGEGLHFSRYVAEVCDPLPCVMGNAEWWREWNEELRMKNEKLESHPSFFIPHSSFQKHRVTPSMLQVRGGGGGGLFGEGMRKAAAKRGTELHDLLRQIEWVDECGADIPVCAQKRKHRQECLCHLREEGIDLSVASPFAEALRTPPEGFVELWRERDFEIVDGDAWMSGTFDRVVFARTDGELGATVYDYKTNRRQGQETPAQFAERMRETYAPQMAAYRSAVAHLTGIPLERIRTVLLLSETMEELTIKNEK